MVPVSICIQYLPPANQVCEVYVFTRVCYSVHRRGGGWSRLRSRVQVKGSGQVGCLGPHPGGRLGGSGWEGGFRPTPGDGGVSQHALRQTPQQTTTAAGATHPTGMHSYLPIMLQMTNTCMLCVCCSWDWE